MSIERTFYCDWRECNAHTKTASKRPGMLFLTVEEDAGSTRHFCSWDCVLKHAAETTPVEVIPVGDD